MRYSIIGTGNTAWFFATKLHKAGHECTGVYGRNLVKAQELAANIHATAYDLADNVSQPTDVCIIAVSDRAISEIAQKIIVKDAVVLHTAGAADIKLLSLFTEGHGVIWPIYSIVKDNLPETRIIPTVWEASDTHTANYIKTIADSYTSVCFEADSNKRSWLHLTAVMSNNFTNHIFAIADKLCTEQGLPFSLLLPIIEQSISRLHNVSAYSQQTGPAKRNDTVVIERQLQMLQNTPEWQQLYQAITASIQAMYKADKE